RRWRVSRCRLMPSRNGNRVPSVEPSGRQGIRMTKITTLVLIIAGTWGATRADAAAMDIFLKLDGVQGEATADHHANEIELLSVEFGGQLLVSASAATGGSAGRVRVNELVVRKHLDKASPGLFLHMAAGMHIPKAVIEVQKARTSAFYTITLQDVLVSS